MFGEPRPKDLKPIGNMCGVIPNTPYINSDPRPRMPTAMGSINMRTLFDSGATHSAVNAHIGKRIIESGINLKPSGCQLTDVQGNRLTVIGSLDVPITVLNKTIVWPCLVIAQLAEDCILGSDFMHTNNISINFGACKIFFNDAHLEALSSKSITAIHRTFVPENHHVKFKCTITCPDNIILCPGSLVITNRNEIMEGVYLEEVITKVMRKNVIMVVVTNTNPYPVFIKPTHSVGTITDTSAMEILPVSEAKIATFGTPAQTGPITPPGKEKLEYLKENFNCPLDTPPEIRAQYEALILRNHDVFAQDKFDLGFSDRISHTINMKTPQPVYVKQFRIPDAYEEEIMKHVEQWLKQSVIEECSSPYNSPVFCVPKKTGGLRIVQDMRQINKASYVDKFAIKDVQECVDAVGKHNSCIFSTMDMASGFWQQNLTEDSRDFTAFTIPLLNTQFRWKRTVMGLQGAPASFSRLTALVFKGIEKAITYIDDLLTHSQTHEEQLQLLQQCFDRMREFTMKFNINKCVFGARTVTYLGFQISAEGVSPAKDKVEAVKCFRPPTTIKEVRAFVGFCNYFRRMVPNFSRLAGPLISMTKMNSGWTAGTLPPEAMKSFVDMKTALSSNPVVGYSRSGAQNILTVDASTTGLGAIFSQILNGEEKIVSFWSRTIREHESNYTPYMLEMTAVCSALEHFHEHVFGKKILIYTDHRPLIGTSTMQKKTINRLVENMNIYDIDLRYKKGGENQGADYLSRNSLLAISQEDRFAEIKHHQGRDTLTNAIMVFLKHNALPATEETQKMVLAYASRSYIKDGVLWFVPPRSNISRSVLFTPSNMVPTIIKNAHGTALSGHWSTHLTVSRISESYFWPTMAKDVTEFIKFCDACQRAQLPPKKAELIPWPATSAPNERVHVDLFGPLRGDPRFKYVAVITCVFTKWAEVIPIENKEAPTVAKAIFEEWVCRRGVMRMLVSDGGKEFANNLLGELCKLMNIDHHVVTPYSPQSNGQVERFNKDMKRYLLTMLDDTTNWVAFLKPLQFAHNTAVSKSTHFTPHYLTFLSDPRLPDTISAPNVTYSDTYSADSFRRMQYAYKLVYENNVEARQVYAAHFNKKARDRSFEVGDEVLASFPVHQNIPNKKLASIWKGPFAIVEVSENNILFIKSSPRHRAIRIHTNRVRLYNHFKDIVTEEIPATPSTPSSQSTPPTAPTQPLREEPADDLDIQHSVLSIPRRPVLQAPIVPVVIPEVPIQPILLQRQAGHWRINDPPQHPPQPQLPILGPIDRLATELFRQTRSRGPVNPVLQPPDRPLEYSQRK